MRVTPDSAAFAGAVAAGYTVIPVWAEVMADRETPVSAFGKLVGSEPGFLLESVEGGERWARYSFIGRQPALVLRHHTGDGDPLEATRALLRRYRAPAADELPPLVSGLVGWMTYDVVRYIERLPDANPDEIGAPETCLMLAGSMVVFDHLRQRMLVVENCLDGDYGAAVDRLRQTVAELARPLAYVPVPAPDPTRRPAFSSNFTHAGYEAAVASVKEYIYAGDAFQIVPSQRFRADLGGADPFDVYRAVRLINPSPYMFYIRDDDAIVLGASPETMVNLRGRTITSRPIAGTRPRGRTPEEDASLEAELLGDDKERAEHVMLVDLARNDVGRVAVFGSVRVDDFMVIERYSHVMHIVSQVTGRLRDGLDAIDVIKATFPHGTVSGAPKVRAMEIIDELEPVRRGVYAGLVGYIDFAGNMDTCIALRTMVVKDGIAYIQAGGGVVADSDPAAEDAECHDKAGALLSAVAAAVAR